MEASAPRVGRLLADSRAACRPVILASPRRDRDVGLLPQRLLERVDAVLGLRDHLHPRLAVEQQRTPARTMPWSSAIRILMLLTRPRSFRWAARSRPTPRERRAPPPGLRAPPTSPCPAGSRCRGCRRRAARARACPTGRGPCPPRRRRSLEPLSDHLQLGPACPRGSRFTSTRVGAGVARGVDERLLRDAVHDHLGVGRQLASSRGSRPEAGPGRGRGGRGSRMCVESAVDEPMVVERRGAQLAGEVEQLTHRLVGKRSWSPRAARAAPEERPV